MIFRLRSRALVSAAAFRFDYRVDEGRSPTDYLSLLILLAIDSGLSAIGDAVPAWRSPDDRAGHE